MKISEANIARNQAYEARAVVARFHQMGHYQRGPMKIPVYKFLTLYQGEGREAIPVQFKCPAPVIADENEDVVLNIEALEEGDIVVTPGLVYRKCLWFDSLMAAHFKALQGFKPKDIIKAEKDDAPPVELGTLDATTDQVTKALPKVKPL